MAKPKLSKPAVKLKISWKQIMLALLGALVGSFSTVGIMIPNGLSYGGITGLSRIIQSLTGWNYSLIYYLFAMIIVAIVWISLGFREVRKILLLSIAYPIIMFIMEKMDLHLLQSKDMLLAAVFCGVAFGISNGLTFMAGYSSGGTDSLAKVIRMKLFPHIGISKLTFGIDCLVVVANAFSFGVNIALYSGITMFIAMRLAEAVLYGLTNKIVELKIITSHPDELTQYVMTELGRGVTSSSIVGEYTGEKRKQLKILCSPRESMLIKRLLSDLDQHAFASVSKVDAVWGIGRGFQDINDMEN